MRLLTVLTTLIVTALLAAPLHAAPGRWSFIGPDGGTVCGLAASPSQPNVVYAGLERGGVFRSMDGGASWAFAGYGLEYASPCSLSVDAVRPSTVWLSGGNRLFRSADGGASWKSVAPPLAQYDSVAAVKADPHRASVAYIVINKIATAGKLLRTTNGGATWALVTKAPAGVRTLAIDPGKPNVVYAGALGLFRSTNSGAFQLLRSTATFYVTALVIDPRSSSDLYITALGRFLRSTNRGVSWAPAQGLQYATDLAVSQRLPAFVYAATGSAGIWRSPDGGRSWQPTGPGMYDPLATHVLAPAGSVVAGSASGVFASFNRGASWRSGRGLAGSVITSLAITRQAPQQIYAADLFAGVQRTDDGGASWQRQGPQGLIYDYGVNPIAVAPSDPDTVYLATDQGFFRSVTGGREWDRLPAMECLEPSSLAVDPVDPATLYLGGFPSCGIQGDESCALFKSTDAGTHWSCLAGDLPFPHSGALTGLDPFDRNHLYTNRGDDFYQSPDGGASWQLLSHGISPIDLAVSAARRGLLYAALDHGVGRSIDGGATWTVHAGGLPAQPLLRRIAADPTAPSVVYTADFKTVYRSTDGGLTWKPLGTGLSAVSIDDLKLDPTDPSVVYVTTRETGIRRLSTR